VAGFKKSRGPRASASRVQPMRKYVLALVLLVFIYGPIAVFFLVAAAFFFRYEAAKPPGATMLFPWPVRGCDLGPTGLPPLVDLGPGQTYQGFEGGLYPGASNVRPAAHTAAGQRIAQSIVPLDANGKYDPRGKIVFLPIGASPTNLTWNGYSTPPGSPYHDSSIKGRVLADRSTNPQLVFPDIILGGIPGDWSNPNDPEYGLIDEQLKPQGVNRQQVQIAWLYPFPRQGPTGLEDWTWPSSALSYRDEWKAAVRALKRVYPNVKIAYLGTKHHPYRMIRPGPSNGPLKTRSTAILPSIMTRPKGRWSLLGSRGDLTSGPTTRSPEGMTDSYGRAMMYNLALRVKTIAMSRPAGFTNRPRCF
jgi:hypothetical protein